MITDSKCRNSRFLERASLFFWGNTLYQAVYSDETGTGGVPATGEEPAPGVYGLLATTEMWDGFRVKMEGVAWQI